jgi:hypothetical protein
MDLLQVGQRDAYAFEIAQSSAHPNRPIICELQVDAEAEREAYVAAALGPDGRDNCGMHVGGESGFGSFQLEAPTYAESYGQVDEVVAIPEIESGPHRERAVEWETFTVAEHPRPEIATEQDARVTLLRIGDAGAEAKIVRATAIGIKALKGILGGVARIGEPDTDRAP